MNRIKKLIPYLTFCSILWAQFDTPVTLTATEKEPMRSGEVASIIVEARMDPEWRIYALRNQGSGPVASKVTLTGDVVKKQGLVLEDKPQVKYDDAYETTKRTHKGGTS